MHVRPRLLVVASTFPGGPQDGTPAFVRDLALYESRAFDTLVVVPMIPGASREERIGDVTVRRFRYFPSRWEDLADGAIIENLRDDRRRWLQVPPFFIAEALAIRHAIREHRPNVMHVHWMVPQGIAALATARSVPRLVTTLGGDVYALQGPFARRAKTAVLRSAAAVTTMNGDMRELLVRLGANPATTEVIPMGAAVDEVRAAAAGVHRDATKLLFVGRLVAKKGLGVLLRALRTLPPDLPWSLDVVGDGPLRADAEHTARDLPVRFLGQLGRADLARCYARSAAVVMPSQRAQSGDQDGLPVALLEAMATGCAIVASGLPGIRDAVVDGTSGVLVEPGNEVALGAAIGAVLTDAELRGRLGAAASERAELFSVAAIGERYIDVLKAISSAVA